MPQKGFDYLIKDTGKLVVSENNGAFICELLLEHYIYLRNAQNQLEILIMIETKVSEFHLVYNGV